VRRAACISRLKGIGYGLHEYHDAFEVFPAAYVAADDGKPMHSWRLSLMPYLERYAWMSKYDWNLPWNNPGNRGLLTAADPFPFSCPTSEAVNKNRMVPYVMIVGDEAAIQPGTFTSLADLEDPSNTIIVAEIANSDIFWAEPRDLEFDTMSFRINDPAGNCIGSHHPGGAHVLMADGSVRFLSNDTDPAVVRALCTRTADDNAIVKSAE
jgi:prepilin-type processing-associated H-X9-DG protein